MYSPSTCIVFDNGGDTLKFEYATEEQPKAIKNCVGSFKNQPTRYIADEIDNVRNTSNILLSRAFEKGVITNWQCTLDVWNRAYELLSVKNMKLNDKTFVVSTSPFAPDSVQSELDEVVFEELEFRASLNRPACWFSAYEHSHETTTSNTAVRGCCLVIDSGFSSTFAMPFINMKTRISNVRNTLS